MVTVAVLLGLGASMVPGSDRLRGGWLAVHFDIGGAATRKYLIWLAYRIAHCTARWIEMINYGGLNCGP
jgi:hypothetical protein